MDTDRIELLRAFIADEGDALDRRESGDFWPANHHHIAGLMPRASKLLSLAELEDFYFHLLRLDNAPAVKTELEFEALQKGYSRALAMFPVGYPVMRLDRIKGAFLFGRDDVGSIGGTEPLNLEAYRSRRTHLLWFGAFAHLPGLLAKAAKFKELAQIPGLSCLVADVLVRADLRNSLPFPSGGPWTWGMVMLALQSPGEGEAVVRKLVAADVAPEARETTLSVLRRCLAAAGRQELESLLT